jgi:hypothetical protein
MSGQVKVVGALLAVALVPAQLLAAEVETKSVEPTTSELLEEMKVLRARMDALQAKTDQQVQQATVNSVLRDAEARSTPKLQASSVDFTGGYKDGKFILQSADGKFSLSPSFQLQVRNVTNISDDGDDTSTENGFELRRVKAGVNGNLFSKDLTYEFLFDVPRNSGLTTLQFAWLRYKFVPDWSVRLGQFSDPLGREQTGSSRRTLAAERSLLSDLLIGGDNPVQGASLLFAPAKSGNFRIETAVHDGTNNNNTNFRDTNATGTAADTRSDWGVASRAEFQLIGSKFKGYEDYTARGNKDPLLVFGAGVDFTQTGDSDLLTYTADAQFENAKGLGLFAAVLGRYQTEFNAGTTAAPDFGDVNDIGVVVQAGQIIGKWAKAEWELFARYDVTVLDDERVSDAFDNDIHEITFGTNAYFQGHSLKGTLDVTYLPNGSAVASDGNGVLQSTDSQFVLRAQFQLLI